MTTAKGIKKLTLAYEPTYNAIIKEMQTFASTVDSLDLAELAVLVDNAAYHLFQRLHDLFDALAKAERPAHPGRGQATEETA